MSDYPDNAVEADWIKPTPTREFWGWDLWTWEFQTPPF